MVSHNASVTVGQTAKPQMDGRQRCQRHHTA